jgi:hypothetical protein
MSKIANGLGLVGPLYRLVTPYGIYGSEVILREVKNLEWWGLTPPQHDDFAQNVVLSPSPVLRIDSVKNLSTDFKPSLRSRLHRNLSVIRNYISKCILFWAKLSMTEEMSLDLS